VRIAYVLNVEDLKHAVTALEEALNVSREGRRHKATEKSRSGGPGGSSHRWQEKEQNSGIFSR